ncbi:hypothetical protein [Fervidobacterium gondwanense]|uniref:Uncharacterized protein n=1 Tax=Fervidobacterium gondwanense DSM 13020 TaxID=1121883 RepID=A0A1M7SUV1_FERGO|nr:hypothetical protein [Fervidobacterium gondwanense]SHN62164.1 hypothetical protein SAMN02745226_01247 [Fervidobacterium gondwanense DSM 13020]
MKHRNVIVFLLVTMLIFLSTSGFAKWTEKKEKDPKTGKPAVIIVSPEGKANPNKSLPNLTASLVISTVGSSENVYIRFGIALPFVIKEIPAQIKIIQPGKKNPKVVDAKLVSYNGYWYIVDGHKFSKDLKNASSVELILNFGMFSVTVNIPIN